MRFCCLISGRELDFQKSHFIPVEERNPRAAVLGFTTGSVVKKTCNEGYVL